MQQQAELVGPEAMAAEAVGEAGVLEILDPQLGLAAPHVPVVERKRREVGAAGHHEAEVAAFLQLLGFVDDAALVRPGVGGIPSLAGQAHLLPGLLVLPLGLRDERGGQCRQARVGGKADGVVDLLALAVGVEGRDREAAVGAQFDRDVGPAGADGGDQALEDGDDAPRLACAVPGRKTAVMSWSVSPSKMSSGWYMCWR